MAIFLGLLVGVAAALAVFAAGLLLPGRFAEWRGRAATARLPHPDLPPFVRRILAARRLERIRAQLPEALTGLSTSVRAGLSLPQAIQSAGGQLADPLGGEFRTIWSATAMGATLEQALEAFEKRAPLPEIRLLVAGLKLARTTGGSLAPMLDRLTATVREREKLRAQVAVLTAQGRLSGWVVGSMPAALLLVMSLVDPAFVRPLVATPMGWALLAAAVALESLGIFMIRAIVRVEP